MAKTFYTEREIEDLHRRGILVLDVDDNVVLTDLAQDKALALGIRLNRVGSSSKAAPSASAPVVAPSQAEIVAKVKAAVIARLGSGVDQALLDTVITRVLAQIK